MSATNRGAVRNADDFYATPVDVADSFLRAVTLPDGHWLEPCAGNGAIVKSVNRSGVKWLLVELRAEERVTLLSLAPAVLCPADYLELTGDAPRFDVGMTNPPFNLAAEFYAKMRAHCDHVVLLLRLNWLASQKRTFLSADMPDVYVLPKRPCFTGNGKTDATEYAWMHWHGEARRAGKVMRL